MPLVKLMIFFIDGAQITKNFVYPLPWVTLPKDKHNFNLFIQVLTDEILQALKGQVNLFAKFRHFDVRPCEKTE